MTQTYNADEDAEKPLNPRQLRFVQEYLKDFNAAQAAIRCGYSPRSAAAQASRLLTKANISAAVQRGRGKLTKKIDITQEAIIFELARLGFSDARRAATWNDKGVVFKASDEIDDDTAAAIQEIAVSADGRPKLKMASKSQALKMLGDYLGMAQPDMMMLLLARLLGGQQDKSEAVDPREAARRAAMLLRQGRFTVPEGE
jgi:phage terminase small subunit